MRRWAWRGVLAVLVLTLALAGVVGIRAFTHACDGSLEGLRYLANVRAQLASATAPPPSPPAPTPSQARAPPAGPAPTPLLPTLQSPTIAQRAREAAGLAGDVALVALIRVKQHDAVAYPAHAVAYPAHMVAARTLDVAGCGRDVVRLQWLKAGLHASTDREIEGVAAALVQHAGDGDDLADLRRIVRTWTERATQSVSLRRVLAALDDRKT